MRQIAITLFTTLFLFFLPKADAMDQAPVAVNGILDLRDFANKLEIIKLSGEWEFYWKDFIEYDDRDTNKREAIIVSVPSYWTRYSDKIHDISRFGYGSYRLRILFPENYLDTCMLKVPIFDSSFELFINGELVGKNGKVGKTRETSEPFYAPLDYEIIIESQEVELVFHVSNFDHRRGGFWKTMLMGQSNILRHKSARSDLLNNALIGILFGSFILFLVFFLLEKNTISFLYFSLASFGMLLRLLNTGTFSEKHLFNESWEWIVRLEYIGTFLTYIFGMLYFEKIFPSERIKKLTVLNTVIFSILGAGVLFLNVYTFSYSILLLQLVGILFLIYYILYSFIGMLKKKKVQTIFFFTVVIFLVAIVNDTFISNSVSGISLEYMVPIAFFVLIAAQTIILIMQWRSNFYEKIALHAELQYINKNLENIVEKRTNEVKKMNDELQSMLDFKNRIFSIIAHDLKSPVSSLAQYSDLLVEEFTNSKKESIMYEFNRLAYSSVDLIDNLLHWGVKQGRRFYYEPENVRIINIALEIRNLTKQALEKKNISFNISASEELTAFCDASLLKITLRNLINNAIKFTPRDGILSLTAQIEKDHVLIILKDSGIGMDKGKINEIMNSNTTSTIGTEGEKGTGIGFLVVKELVSINRGTLHIESKPGNGTSVMFTLPGKP